MKTPVLHAFSLLLISEVKRFCKRFPRVRGKGLTLQSLIDAELIGNKTSKAY